MRRFFIGLLCLLPAGCGNSSSSSIYSVSAAHAPPCAHAARAKSLPARFPGDFPFPDGATVTSSRRKGPATIISVVLPTSSFRDTANFFRAKLPETGYKVVYWEADPPRDSEGAYRGKGYAGRWTLHAIKNCPQGIRMQVAAQSAK